MLNHRTHILGPDRDWVVFVHGAGGSSSIWYKQIRDFSAHFNVLLIDLRGHGDSSRDTAPTRPYTFDEIGMEIVEVMDHLEIDSAHFVGISLGTILIRAIGERAPERIRSMVLGGAVTRLNLRTRVLVNIGTAVKRVVPYMSLYRLFAWIVMPRRHHRESRLLFAREARRLEQKEFLRWWTMTNEVNPLLRLFEEKELGVPTLYLMGEEDHMFLPPVRRLVERHRESVLKIVPKSGHVVNVDRPDAFNAIAIEFIRSVISARGVRHSAQEVRHSVHHPGYPPAASRLHLREILPDSPSVGPHVAASDSRE